MTLSVKAILLDLDGVLYVGQEPLPGACDAFSRLRETGLPIAGITNTTTQAKSHVVDKLHTLGFDFTSEDDERPDFIVMGDIGSAGYDPVKLQHIFDLIMDGAELLALHKNRFWQKPEGLELDLGTYVIAFEYATDKEAKVLGKPAVSFFHLICERLNVSPEEALMVGDDIKSDIGGAIDAGLKTALVKTGKYREDFAKHTGIKPNLTLPSIADLPDALNLL